MTADKAQHAATLFETGFRAASRTKLAPSTIRNRTALKSILWDQMQSLVNWEIDQVVIGFQQGYRTRDM